MVQDSAGEKVLHLSCPHTRQWIWSLLMKSQVLCCLAVAAWMAWVLRTGGCKWESQSVLGRGPEKTSGHHFHPWFLNIVSFPVYKPVLNSTFWKILFWFSLLRNHCDIHFLLLVSWGAKPQTHKPSVNLELQDDLGSRGQVWPLPPSALTPWTGTKLLSWVKTEGKGESSTPSTEQNKHAMLVLWFYR